MKPQKRQIRRLEKAINEIIKIHDDDQGSSTTMQVLDMLNTEMINREYGEEY